MRKCIRSGFGTITPPLRRVGVSFQNYHVISSNANTHSLKRSPYKTQDLAQQTQHRDISVLHRRVIQSSISNSNSSSSRYILLEKDFDTAISLVRKYDPSGFLPGVLLPSDARLGYFAIRAFWVETGFRLSELPVGGNLAPNHTKGRGSQTYSSSSSGKWSIMTVTPEDRIRWWRKGVHALFQHDGLDNDSSDGNGNTSTSAAIVQSHPILRLLKHTLNYHSLSKEHFFQVLDGRDRDVNIKQYLTMADFIQHSQQCCGSLLNLTLECLDIPYHSNIDSDRGTHPAVHVSAKHIGTCHGIANALRMSIPVVSNTGKIIIPQELCDIHGVRSPRYLLSALGQGDGRCQKALQNAVRDIVWEARDYLAKARERREEILTFEQGGRAMAALLPGLAAETFLNRLEMSGYDLTSKYLRQVGPFEHVFCATRMIQARWNETY